MFQTLHIYIKHFKKTILTLIFDFYILFYFSHSRVNTEVQKIVLGVELMKETEAVTSSYSDRAGKNATEKDRLDHRKASQKF